MTTTSSLEQQSPNDAQSEVMSTSTVSKVEEFNRMADIENVWEEKYQKLKKLTIKMKQKTLDQQATIKKLEAAAAGGGKDKDKDKVAQLTKNYASLQTQNDEQGDLIDEQKKTISTMKKDLEQSVADGVEAKEKVANLEGELTSLKSAHSLVESDLENVRKELSGVELVKKEQEKTIADFQGKEESMKKENQDMSEKLSNLKGADKKHDLLDMELETAERRIEELHKLVQEMEEKVAHAHTDRDRETSLKETAEQLKKDLEHSLERESERAEEFKSKLSESRSTVSGLELDMSAIRGENAALAKRVQELGSDNERLTCELSEATGSAANNAQTLTKRNESLQKMVSELEIVT